MTWKDEEERSGRVRCTIRIWTRLHVKDVGRYPMEHGDIVVDTIDEISTDDITDDLARESGFETVDDLLRTVKHGVGNIVYLIRFHYVPAGGWDRTAR
jgi:isopentenyl phosphate kinase